MMAARPLSFRLMAALRRAYLRKRIASAVEDIAWLEATLEQVPRQLAAHQRQIGAWRTELAAAQPMPPATRTALAARAATNLGRAS